MWFYFGLAKPLALDLALEVLYPQLARCWGSRFVRRMLQQSRSAAANSLQTHQHGMVYSAGFCQPWTYFVAAHPVQIFLLGISHSAEGPSYLRGSSVV